MRTSSGLSICPSVRATIHSTVCWIVWFISHLLPRCCLPPSCYWWWRWRWLPSNRMPIHRCRWYFGRWRIERCDVFVGLMYLLIGSSEWLTIVWQFTTLNWIMGKHNVHPDAGLIDTPTVWTDSDTDGRSDEMTNWYTCDTQCISRFAVNAFFWSLSVRVFRSSLFWLTLIWNDFLVTLDKFL